MEVEAKKTRTPFVACDLKDHSINAMNYYFDVLRKSGDNTILYNYLGKLYVPADPYSASGDQQKKKEKKYEDNEEKIKMFLDGQCRSRQASAHIKLDKAHKKVGEGICALAKDNKADFIVMGASDLSKFVNRVFSGTSDYVMHHANRPIVCVPGTFSDQRKPRVVLVAIDLKEHSKYAFEFFYRCLRKDDDEKPFLLHCCPPLDGSADHEKQTKHAEDEKDAKRYMEWINKEKMPANIIVDKHHKKVGEAICVCAEERHVDMIIMGCRELSFLHRHMKEGVSDYVMHHAKIVVCCVPLPKDARE